MSSGIKLPESKKRIAIVKRLASVDTMFEDLYTIMKDQIEKQRLKGLNATLNDKEVKVIGELIDGLVKLSREERERLKSESFNEALSQLTESEIAALILESKSKPKS